MRRHSRAAKRRNIEDYLKPTSQNNRRKRNLESMATFRKRADKDRERDYKKLGEKGNQGSERASSLSWFYSFVTATLTSVGVYYTSNEETHNFESSYLSSQRATNRRIVSRCRRAPIGSVNSMATAITSHALDAKQAFPL
jgi:hypothetical protein